MYNGRLLKLENGAWQEAATIEELQAQDPFVKSIAERQELEENLLKKALEDLSFAAVYDGEYQWVNPLKGQVAAPRPSSGGSGGGGGGGGAPSSGGSSSGADGEDMQWSPPIL